MKAMLAISISRMPDSVNTATKEGIAWGIGNDEDVAWIKENTASRDCTITVAIPAVFADYATLLHPGGQLGYLDTGASDIVFWDAPKTTLCCGWNYVLVRAGPQQAASWRPADSQYDWKSTELPELMFPADRSSGCSRLSGTTTGPASAARRR